MIKILLGDSKGTAKSVGVTSRSALKVSPIEEDVPEIGTANNLRYYSAVLGSTGADSGSTNMNVNGAVTSQEFFIESNENYDIHIMLLVIIIADTAIVHSKFGNINALANGWDLHITEAGAETKLINVAKTGGQAIAQAGGLNGFGDSVTSFELSNWTGTEDAQLITLPVGDYVPKGLRIGRGTKDKISSVVNDDLTGLTEFTVRAIGYGHYP